MPREIIMYQTNVSKANFVDAASRMNDHPDEGRTGNGPCFAAQFIHATRGHSIIGIEGKGGACPQRA
jgi:hypothetical protein